MTPRDISIVIPTWRRPSSLVRTLGEILACQPGPAEVLVHVDAGDAETQSAIEPRFGHTVRWLQCETTKVPAAGGIAL